MYGDVFVGFFGFFSVCFVWCYFDVCYVFCWWFYGYLWGVVGWGCGGICYFFWCVFVIFVFIWLDVFGGVLGVGIVGVDFRAVGCFGGLF